MLSLERMSKRVLNGFIARGTTRKNANINLDRNIISREWRKLCISQSDDERIDAAIDIFLSVLSYLAKIGCDNIEERVWIRLQQRGMMKRENNNI